ncbi:MAG: hypothetical protein WAW86_07105 [Gammaproteobacteria bacterium]
MVSYVDDRQGVVKTDWASIRDRVASVEPKFAQLVDELSPGKDFPLYLIYLPYGVLKGDTQHSYLPDNKGGYYSLTDPAVPKELLRDIGYGVGGSPMGMVLEKQLEYFIDFKHKKVTIPWLIYSPGNFFPISTILGAQGAEVYAPNGLLTVSSGARSTFMLPNIGCNSHFVGLKRDFNLKGAAPKSSYDHWDIFRGIIASNIIDCDWRCCFMYFSEPWVNRLHNDAAWMRLRLYLHEIVWKKFEYERNRIYYDMTFSMIQEKRNLKPNPYLVDIAKHLFAVAVGAAPGYGPSSNDNGLPVQIIQSAFIDSYGLKKYAPTIMEPLHFDSSNNKSGIYYSLQNPAAHIFSPKSREGSSTILEMVELEYLMKVFCEELSQDSNICSDTIIGKIAKNMAFDYYHNKSDKQNIISASSLIPQTDKRFLAVPAKEVNVALKFAEDAAFVRGCVRIRPLNS